MADGPVTEVEVQRHGREPGRREDRVVVEEPMEIRLEFGPLEARLGKSVSITMRTPGEDFELASGLLFSEGIIESAAELKGVERCGPPAAGRSESNVVKVSLSPEAEIDPVRLQRNLISSSACGVCGKASLEAVVPAEPVGPVPAGPRLSAATIQAWPARLREGQDAFAATGGVHAAGVFTPGGELALLREDVGRHNAVDKVVGALLARGELPVGERCLVVSGRTSFEILQKAIRAGFPVVAGVGAPSNLAIELARRFGLTLLGFLREDGFNVYAGEERVE
ncbi:MAG: formate dehydrogenase accessory sulfurtransferase FdhD [Deltaproteobacteria bacterium]|nr:formate dehydrogenase accessory sulfurtransferase FdhD [Deltaproteobacteria bacterium]